MSKQKFTAILLPQDEGGYQVFFPTPGVHHRRGHRERGVSQRQRRP